MKHLLLYFLSTSADKTQNILRKNILKTFHCYYPQKTNLLMPDRLFPYKSISRSRNIMVSELFAAICCFLDGRLCLDSVIICMLLF